MRVIPQALTQRAQWVVWRLEQRGDGKPTKVPYDAKTGRHASSTDPTTWCDYATAVAAWQAGGYSGVGFVFTDADPLWLLDLDACADGAGGWKPYVNTTLARLHGASVELSQSGTGLHVVGQCDAAAMAGRRNRWNDADGNAFEFYTTGRFVALGGGDWSGEITGDQTAALSEIVPAADVVPGTTDTPAAWTTAPRADWNGPTDDDDLLSRALNSGSASAAFGGKASFSALWNADPEALARAFPPDQGGDGYDESRADSALAFHLAFWTGCDCERIERLMLRSGLAREKWTKRKKYLRDTILKACSMTQNVIGDAATPVAVSLDDFTAYLPDHRYIFIPTRSSWPGSSVDARVAWPEGADGKPMKPSRWLDRHKAVEQMTWSPGDPLFIEGRLIDTGGWINRPGVTTFNLYRPPTLGGGDAGDVRPWLDHLHRIYPDDAAHLLLCFAHRVQRPGEKINHGIVLGGKPGIGKDTILEPVKHAVGPWNWNEVSPIALLGRFNSFVKSVVLRISEARDLGDMDRFKFYDHLKTYTAAPPDVMRCDEKNVREYMVPNVCFAIITTNYRTDGIYLPADDRRHYVAWSDCEREDFSDDYWTRLWRWYHSGGMDNVAAYLATLDLAEFDPHAPPRKTDAFWHIVNAGRAPEETELADVLGGMEPANPAAVTLDMLIGAAAFRHPGLADWLKDRNRRRQIPHRLEAAGYEPVLNPSAKDGLWSIGQRRQTVYARSDLTVRDRLAAASELGRQ